MEIDLDKWAAEAEKLKRSIVDDADVHATMLLDQYADRVIALCEEVKRDREIIKHLNEERAHNAMQALKMEEENKRLREALERIKSDHESQDPNFFYQINKDVYDIAVGHYRVAVHALKGWKLPEAIRGEE